MAGLRTRPGHCGEFKPSISLFIAALLLMPLVRRPRVIPGPPGH